MKNSLSKNIKFFNFVLCLSVYFFLDFTYHNSSITIAYKYYGFEIYESFHMLDFFNPIIVSTIIFLISHRSISPFIYFIEYLLLIMLLIPNLIIWKEIGLPIAVILGIVYLMFAVYFFSRIKLKVSMSVFPRRAVLPFLTMVTVLMMLPFFREYGLNVNLKNLLFQEIYDTRIESFNEGLLTRYFKSWLFAITIPIVLIYSLIKKKFYLQYSPV